MTTVQAALLVCALSGAPAASDQTVLLDFTASWCGPCRQMLPVVERLAAEGIPVRKVDIDSEPQLAKQFGVKGVPCFVMISGGRETGRLVGATGYEQLRQLVAAGGNVPANSLPPSMPAPPTMPTSLAAHSAAVPAATPTTAASNGQITQQLIDRLMAASVRLKIYDEGGQSVGSGTIIDCREGEALVLTCGHIFRDSNGQGRVTVDLQTADGAQDLPGRVIGYDLESDVGLLSFRPGVEVAAAKIAPPGYAVRPNDVVVSIGCNHGDPATARVSRVTTIDKFLGPPNLQVAGQPVQGRSGGGLFSADGHVIGVCNAADPEDDEGLYAALAAVHAEIHQFGLAKFCLPNEPIAAVAPPTMPAKMPAFGSADASQTLPTSGSLPVTQAAQLATSQLTNAAQAMTPVAAQALAQARSLAGGSHSAAEQAALAELGNLSAGAEVVCIVRPLADARAKSKVIVIDNASPDFLRQLASDQRRQDARFATSHQVPVAGESTTTATAAGSWQPQWRSPQK
ncbi:MAG: trypsin-like peptidase domain-containing protein [Planctomycetaceae bacterium]|nr:trypsin-like peptidase domain-containing protein [Planctomycetaceae bacterium]